MRLKSTCLGLLGLLGAACGEGMDPTGAIGQDDTESASGALTEAAAAESSTWISDLTFAGGNNGWGPVERDRSNGENGLGDGRTLTLNGVSHGKGLGVHAGSTVLFDLAGKYQRFEASVGVDDEAGNLGSVIFRVLGDGVLLFDSGRMTATSTTKTVSVAITGVKRLELVVTDAGDGRSWDHADWASARVIKTAVVTPPPVTPPPVTPPPVTPPPVTPPPVTPPPVTPPPPATGKCKLGQNTSLGGRQIFPKDNEWNRDITADQVDPNSSAYINSMGAGVSLRPDFGRSYDGHPFGIQYVVVPTNQPRVPVGFDYDDESDPGPYPFPMDAPIEGGPDSDGDRHIIAVDCEGGRLYETFSTWPKAGGFDAASGAIFNLDSNALRPKGWTSADAAGLPVFAGLVRHDEVVERGEINHALRFTVRNSQRAYVWPATHWASTKTDRNLPPMGMRVRLKASFDVSRFPKDAQVILRALKKYGMFMADNGADWFLSGAPNESWDEDALFTLRQVKGSDFEVLKMGEIVRP